MATGPSSAFADAYEDTVLTSFGMLDADDDHDDDLDDDFDDLDDLDDDNEYGGDYEWFGAEDDLDDIEDQIDNDLYGSYYGLAPSDTDVETVAAALNIGVLIPYAAKYELVEGIVEGLKNTLGGNEARELAVQLIGEPDFANWAALSMSQRESLIAAAVGSAAMPGLEMTWDDALSEAWNAKAGSIGEMASNAASGAWNAAWSLFVTDVPTMAKGWLSEIPGVERALHAAGVANVDDQVINQLAMSYWVMHQAGIPIYRWLAESVNVQAPAMVTPAQDFDLPEAPDGFESPVDVAPPMAGMKMPRPQTILGIGYALLCGGAAFGILK